MKRVIWEAFKEPHYKATFLILSAGVTLKLSPGWIALVLIGYFICGDIDRRLSRRARWEVIESEVYDWKPVSDASNGSEKEEKGAFVRVKLSPDNNILFGRIAQLLWKIE